MEQPPPGDAGYTAGMEHELRLLSEAMTEPLPGECLVCYVLRMLDFGCKGHRWLERYRDLRAPRATALERRMHRLGGFCDCEILMNVFQLNPWLFEFDRHGDPILESMPCCPGVRGGSTQPCGMWVGRRRGRWPSMGY